MRCAVILFVFLVSACTSLFLDTYEYEPASLSEYPATLVLGDVIKDLSAMEFVKGIRFRSKIKGIIKVTSINGKFVSETEMSTFYVGEYVRKLQVKLIPDREYNLKVDFDAKMEPQLHKDVRGQVNLKFRAEPGHMYKVHAFVSGSSVGVIVIDGNDKVVSNEFVGKVTEYDPPLPMLAYIKGNTN